MTIYLIFGLFLGAVTLGSTMLITLLVRRTKKKIHEVDALLDCVLMGEAPLVSEMTAESRVSKLSFKAGRVIEMYTKEVNQTRTEKETIQGLLADISHQTKTPLASISMYTDLLLEEELSVAEQREFLLCTKNSTEKLQWLMENLVKISRLEVGAIQLAPFFSDIRPTITKAIQAVLPTADKKNMEIVLADFPPQLLYHDLKWTHEALVNVLENAIKYTIVGDEQSTAINDDSEKYTSSKSDDIKGDSEKRNAGMSDGTKDEKERYNEDKDGSGKNDDNKDGSSTVGKKKIVVTVEPLTLYTKIMITDYGIGIRQDEWHLIFKRFYRSQAVKDVEGAGLGLYLATLIMEKQKGYLMVDSVLGKFTTFSLFLLKHE